MSPSPCSLLPPPALSENSSDIVYLEVFDNPNVNTNIGDVNNDNEVNIADVTALIDKLLAGN